MWIRNTAHGPRPQNPAAGAVFSDLGSQLEDLFTHVMRCERWARFDDRLDLAFSVERPRPRSHLEKEVIRGGH